MKYTEIFNKSIITKDFFHAKSPFRKYWMVKNKKHKIYFELSTFDKGNECWMLNFFNSVK